MHNKMLLRYACISMHRSFITCHLSVSAATHLKPAAQHMAMRTVE